LNKIVELAVGGVVGTTTDVLTGGNSPIRVKFSTPSFSKPESSHAVNKSKPNMLAV
jgi:hypothetical protein